MYRTRCIHCNSLGAVLPSQQYMCKDQQMLNHDSVYTKYILEVDGTFGGCPSGSPHCTR